MRSTRFEAEIRAASEDALILLGADFSQIHDKIRNARIDLMLGTSNGRQISKKEGIPLVRVGLPTTIEWGNAQLLVGYEGATRLADAITNALLDENNFEQWGIIKQPDRRSCHKGLGQGLRAQDFEVILFHPARLK